jgi:hypothetical protein
MPSSLRATPVAALVLKNAKDRFPLCRRRDAGWSRLG